MKQPIIFAVPNTPRQELWFAAYHGEPYSGGGNPLADPSRYGIQVRALTPTINKKNNSFSVRLHGRRIGGYINGHGDFVVRVIALPRPRGAKCSG